MREFIEDAGRADTLPELLASFERAVRRLDFEHYSFSCWEAKGGSGASPAGEHRILAQNYPSPWVDRYRDRDYFSKDPVIRHARGTAKPFQWSDLAVQGSREEAVLQEAFAAGLREGMAVPIHEPWGRIYLTTLATRRAASAAALDADQLRTQAHMLAVIFHARYAALGGLQARDRPVGLTPRESECLTWVAQGKSSWDIGQLMAVSEHTVNFHLKNAMRKFDTASRVTAAVRAASLGLIHLP
ncbi:LuxR family transcriptional regulator [Roseateles flavus]|uniref:LuxR family transcriptional regulator n=1 Tax=Roseateles flavus TaxID=3149041 RepID=A0ABV0GCR9_9BURK